MIAYCGRPRYGDPESDRLQREKSSTVVVAARPDSVGA
jgi:hypothetical protein